MRQVSYPKFESAVCLWRYRRAAARALGLEGSAFHCVPGKQKGDASQSRYTKSTVSPRAPTAMAAMSCGCDISGCCVGASARVLLQWGAHARGEHVARSSSAGKRVGTGRARRGVSALSRRRCAGRGRCKSPWRGFARIGAPRFRRGLAQPSVAAHQLLVRGLLVLDELVRAAA